MSKYLVLLCSKNFLELKPSKKFKFEFSDMTINFRQITDQNDKTISNLDKGWLIEVKICEKNLDTAIIGALNFSESFINIFSLYIGLPIHKPKIILAYDISKNKKQRIFRQYVHDVPVSVEGSEIEFDAFFDVVQKVYNFDNGSEKLNNKNRVFRAMRWLRKGLTSSDPLDGFLFLWHGLECLNSPLADYYGVNKKILKKTGTCSECSADINIFVNAGIELFLNEMIEDTEKSKIRKIRNGIAHGYKHIYPLSEQAYKMIPLMAKLLFCGISKFIEFTNTSEINNNLLRANPLKDNGFIYIEGFIIEKDLSKIGIKNYYPYFEMNIQNNHLKPISFINNVFKSEKFFTSSKNLKLHIEDTEYHHTN